MLTLAQAAEFFARSAARCEAELEGLVVTVVETAAVMAKGYIGQEQSEWAPLSSATVDGFRHEYGFWIIGKEARGYGGYESPLLRRGDMRDSIDCEAEGLVGVVGSNDKVMLYQEMGTDFARYPIPPRPVLAKGLMEAAGLVQGLSNEVFIKLLVPRP